MTTEQLQAVAERINTGTADAETTRALVVFNTTESPITGVATFRAAMAWPAGTQLPPIVVSELDGPPVASGVTGLIEEPDRKGRASHRHLAFTLAFAVRDIPAGGWRTYLACYQEIAAGAGTRGLPLPAAGLAVVETRRHGGELPPAGTF